MNEKIKPINLIANELTETKIQLAEYRVAYQELYEEVERLKQIETLIENNKELKELIDEIKESKEGKNNE